MRPNDNVLKFLNGSNFSNLEKIHLPRTEVIYSRIELIKGITANKNVIHVGCCDHINLIDSKINNNTYLHKILTESSNQCLGIDVDQTAIEYLNKIGFNNVFHHDLLSADVSIFKNNHWDFIVLGEILEHVDNPILFLQTIHAKLKPYVHKIIITVPNAFSLFNSNNFSKGIERINTDHRYWFTPYTLLKISTLSNFSSHELFFVDRSNLTIKDKLIKWYYILQNKDPFKSARFKLDRATGLLLVSEF